MDAGDFGPFVHAVRVAAAAAVTTDLEKSRRLIMVGPPSWTRVRAVLTAVRRPLRRRPKSQRRYSINPIRLCHRRGGHITSDTGRLAQFRPSGSAPDVPLTEIGRENLVLVHVDAAEHHAG